MTVNPLAFWRNKKTTLSGLAREYYFGNGISAHGTLVCDNDVYIDGSFTGELSSNGLVELDVNAKTAGKLTARTILIGGRCEGELQAKENISILSSAQVFGKVSARTVEVQSGTRMQATIITETS